MPNEGFNKHTNQSDEWETPWWLFKALDAEFGFTLDAAATLENKKCANWVGLNHNQGRKWMRGERVFCNPPYNDIRTFIDKALSYEAMTVLLLPVRTDSDWHLCLYESSRVKFRWFRKRIQFEYEGKPAGSPRFASMLAIVLPQ